MGPKKVIVTTDQSSAETESINTELLKSIQSKLVNIEAKLDDSVKRVHVVEVQLVEAQDRILEAETSIKTLQDNYKAVCERLLYLEAENKDRKYENLVLKAGMNNVRQRGMLQSVRVYNMKDEVKSSREASSYLYDHLIKQALIDPVTGEHPGAFNCIEYCHLLPPTPDNKDKYSGFNYILRFTTRFWKYLFFDQKKKMVGAYKDREGMTIKVSHDYTYDNRACLKVLHAAVDKGDVARITVRGERLLFKTSVEGNWVTVKNPYAVTPAGMAKL